MRNRKPTSYNMLCHQWLRICSTLLSFPHSWFITGFLTRITRRVPLVEQELFTLLVHLRLPPLFSGNRITRSLVLFCSKANTIKLEKIQERALRFIYEDYNSTYEELLHIAKVPSLQIRRMRTMAIECFFFF
jgi:hypothetical protein